MKKITDKIEWFMDLGGTKKDVTFLVISGIALILSLCKIQPFPFDIKADVLVSLALIASVIIGEHFAAGEVAFIMQIGGLLEELTVAKARAGIEKLVHLTLQTAHLLLSNINTIRYKQRNQ